MRAVYEFLRELEPNNNREWFASHRAQFEQAKRQATEFCDALVPLTPATFEFPELLRHYRDMRFRPDAEPYHTQCTIRFAAKGSGPASLRPSARLCIAPKATRLTVGVLPRGPMLRALRSDPKWAEFQAKLPTIDDPAQRRFLVEFGYSQKQAASKSFARTVAADLATTAPFMDWVMTHW